MKRYRLVDGVMVEDENGEYCLHADVISADNVAANTLIVQLDSLKAQVEAWYG